jgi:hypothetical protein
MSRHGRRERAVVFATAWPPDPRAASSGSWAGEARRRRGRGGGGEEGSAFSAAAPERRSLLMSAFFLQRACRMPDLHPAGAGRELSPAQSSTREAVAGRERSPAPPLLAAPKPPRSDLRVGRGSCGDGERVGRG